MPVQLGPATGTLTIHTGRAGMAAKAGHDLVIEAERWEATLDPAAQTLSARIDVSSLRVREGLGGVKPLSDGDKADIQKTLGEKILKTAQHPEVAFESTAISGAGEPRWQIDGRLTLVGVSNSLSIPVTRTERGEEVELSASVRFLQSAFGIKPHSAMMGALKVADEVEIRVQAHVPSSQLPQ